MTTSDPPPVGYTPAEAAALCGVSIDTVRRYRKAGRFPRCVRVGDGTNAAWRIPLEDLVASGLYVPGAPAEPVAASLPIATATSEPSGRPPVAAADDDDRLAETQEQVRWLREQNEQLLDLITRLTAGPASTAVTRLTTEPRSAA
jgi:hypothetical protein